MLGHDLRNPLTSIDAGARLLQKTPLNEKATTIVAMMQDSVRRMAKIIDNVMDLARGRLGGGIALNRAREPLGRVLDQVVAEARLTHPERAIDVAFDLTAPVDYDRSRVARLFSNLLGNALLYGKADAPVTVQASTRDGTFELSVANAGDQIPARRASACSSRSHAGTCGRTSRASDSGLYIASQIARAHGGTLDVTSTAAETRFTFRMPLG